MIFQDNIHPSILALLCTLEFFFFFSGDTKGDHAPRDSYEVIKTFFYTVQFLYILALVTEALSAKSVKEG